MESRGGGRKDGAIPTGALLSFAAANIPVAIITLAVTVHLPRYFAGHLALPLTVVGASFAIVRLIDLLLDPALGILMDRTRTRIGRYRTWLLASAPVLMAAVWFLMNAAPGTDQTHLIGWLLLLYIGYSMLLLSHLAWGAKLAESYDQRSRMFGAVTGMGFAGAAVALLIPVGAQALGYSDAVGVQAMMGFIVLTTPITVILAAWRTPERVSVDETRHFGLRDYAALLARPNILRLLLADLLVTLGPGWMSALYLFFFKDFRGFDTGQANILLMVYITSGLIGAPLIGLLARRISKHRALLVTTTIFALTLTTQALLPKGDVLATLPSMMICGAMAAGFQVMLRALTADIGDELQLDSGREWMALLYALTTATTKVAGAASIFLTYSLLATLGYDATEGAVNGPAAIEGLRNAFLGGPIVFVMLGGACFIGYRLTAERHAEIRRELDARQAVPLDSLGEPIPTVKAPTPKT